MVVDLLNLYLREITIKVTSLSPTTFCKLYTKSPHNFSGTMLDSSGTDEFDGHCSTPSPVLPLIQLPTHLSVFAPFRSNPGIPSLHDIDSAPISATTILAPPWNDKSDVFSNRQQHIFSRLYMSGKEGSSPPTTSILY